jgi:group I intron endonuclease
MTTQGYIGVTVNLHVRHLAHTAATPRCVSILNNAFKRYGEQAIIRTILYTGSIGMAYNFEKRLRPTKCIGWNIAVGGGLPPDCTGNRHSEETKQKMSISGKGKNAGKASPFKGVTGRYSAETRALIGSYHIGQACSEKCKQRTRDKLSGAKSPMAKSIHLVHKDDLSNIHTFGSISEAATALNLNYSRIRSLYQDAHKKQVATGHTWFCLCSQHLNDPEKAVKACQERKHINAINRPKARGKDNASSQEITIENRKGIIKIFESILQAATAINMSDATLRYHLAQTNKHKKDANYTRSGWRVKYRKVQE